MKFIATVDELARALGLVASVVEPKTTIPILSHVLVSATDNNRIKIMGTDIERECIASVPAVVITPGAAALPAGILKSVATSLPKAAELTVSLTDAGRVSLVASRSRIAMSVLPAADFPAAKDREGSAFRVDGKNLGAILEATIGCASTDATRWHMCGVHLHVLDGALVAAATDMHRLCKRAMDLPAGAEGMPGIIISTKSVNTIIALLGSADGDASVWVTEHRIWVETARASFSTALINSQYLNYQSAIPQSNGPSASFSGADLCAAVDRAAATLPDAKVVAASLISEPEGLVIEVGPRGSETAIEHIDAEFSAAGEIAANAKYLAAMTKAWGTAPIDIHIGPKRTDPIVFTSGAVPEQLYMIMPLKR